MRINKRGEKTLLGWVLRPVLGIAYMIEGAVTIVTFGVVSLGLPLIVAKHLAKERLK